MYMVTWFFNKRTGSNFPRRDASASPGTEGNQPVAGPCGSRPRGGGGGGTFLARKVLSSFFPPSFY